MPTPASIDTSTSPTLARMDRLHTLLDGYAPLRSVFAAPILAFPVDGVTADEGVRAALWCPRRNGAVATVGGTSVTAPLLPIGARGKTDLVTYLCLSILVHCPDVANLAATNTSYRAAVAVSDAFLLALIAHLVDPTPGNSLWHKLELLPETTDFRQAENKAHLRSDTYLRLHSQIVNP